MNETSIPPPALDQHNVPNHSPVMKHQSSQPIIHVSLSPRLELNHVYDNGLHALCRFHIQNKCLQNSVVVKLRSNLKEQVTFQLTNENFPDWNRVDTHPPISPFPTHSSSCFGPRTVVQSTSNINTAVSHLRSTDSSLPLSNSIVSSFSGDSLELTQVLSPLGPTYDASIMADPPSLYLPQGLVAPHPFVPQPLTVSSKIYIRSSHPSSSVTSPISGISFSPSDTNDQALLHRTSSIVSDQANDGISNGQTALMHHSMVTNTVTAAQLGAYAMGGAALEFNQLFNYVNLIDRVTLDPCETRELILSFLPATQSRCYDLYSERDGSSGAASAANPSNTTLNQSSAIFSASDVEANTYDFRDVSGMLMFSAYHVPIEFEKSDLSTGLGSPNVLSATDPPSIYPTNISSDFDRGTLVANLSAKPDCNVAVKFKARVCKSVLWSEATQSGLLFDDCVLDGTFIRDFTVWNKSEIDLFWTLNTAAVSRSLTFTDYNTGEPLDTSQPITSYSHCRVRVTYKPKLVGDFSYEIQLENVNDDTNIESVKIHCMVRSAVQDDSLLVLSGQHLDFGDVTTGMWNKATLVLKNISEHVMEIKFTVEGANGRVVHLPHPELSPDYEPIGLGLEGTIYDTGLRAFGISRSSGPVRLAPIQSHESSLASSPISNRSVSMDLTLNDLVRRSEPLPSSGIGVKSYLPGLIGSPLADSDVDSNIDLTNTYRRKIPSPRLTIFKQEQNDYSDPESLSSSTVLDRSKGSHPTFNNVLSASQTIHQPPYSTSLNSDDLLGSLPAALTSNIRNRSRIASAVVSGSLDPSNQSPLTNTLSSARSVEEIILKGGMEYSIEVAYIPEKALYSDANATHLVKNMFRIVLSYGKNRKVIQCKMRTCTSYVSVSPTIVSFGETDVGMLKSAPVRITNLSEIPARVELAFASKVLSCTRDEIQIPPKQSVEVKIDLYPRKVNPDYRKQITVLNLLNRSNDQIIEVQSTNIDKQKITWHGFFYRIMTPSSANYIDFGGIVGTYKALRTFSVQNVSKSEIVLSITASTDQITLFLKREAGFPKAPNLAAQKLVLGSMADRKTIKRASSELLVTPTTASSAAYLDLAVMRKNASPVQRTAPGTEAENASSSTTDVVQLLQNINIMDLPRFPPGADQKFVKLVIGLRKSLEAVVMNGELVPITNVPLVLAPGSEMECVAIFQAPSTINRRKKLDSRMLFNLSEFDPTLLPTALTSLPVRELLVRCIVCPSELEVGQRNYNFGTIDLQASMSKTIFVRNKSDAPLLYTITKSGSIASGDVLLENQSGVVPPHGAREVTFTFKPTMSGSFYEKLIVGNVLNPQTSQVIYLKAIVRKPESFAIHTESIDFGTCMVNELSAYRIITLHNTHRHVRLFTIRAGDETNAFCDLEFVAIGSTTVEHDAREVEEKIEALEQKLKIAKRKCQKEKVDKITNAMLKLRRETDTIESTAQESVPVESSIPDPLIGSQQVSSTSVVETGGLASPSAQLFERKIGSLTLPVEPYAIMKVGVAIRAKLSSQDCVFPSAGPMHVKGLIVIHHHKNTDLIKQVAYLATICCDHSSFIDSLDRTIQKHASSSPSLLCSSEVGIITAPATPALIAERFSSIKNDDNANSNTMSPTLIRALQGCGASNSSISSSLIQEYVTVPNTSTAFTRSPSAVSKVACAFLENSIVDLGKFQIGHSALFYFVLLNSGSISVPYCTKDPSVLPRDRDGILNPGERRVVNATIVPVDSGRQSYSIGVWCEGFPQIFTVNFTAVYKDGLVFTNEPLLTNKLPSFAAESAQVSEIDLGFCYNAKRFSHRATICVTNTMPETISMSAASTLSQQVGVFSDAECSICLVDTILRPGESTHVFVAVQPNLAQAPLGTGKLSLTPFESRQLVGGFKFISVSISTGVEICSQHLKFQAIIGPSIFSVSTTSINLGTVFKVSDIETAFSILNLSDRMPLCYSVTCSDSNLVRVHDYPSTIRGTLYVDEYSEIDLKSGLPQTTIKLTIRPRQHGYFCETIWVTNLNCPEQSTPIYISALVDPLYLILDIQDLSPNMMDLQEVALPMLEWEHIFVYQSKNSPPSHSFVTCAEGRNKTIKITNNLPHSISVLPFSNLKLNLFPSADYPISSLLLDNAPLEASVVLFKDRARPCGPVMVAVPGAVWSCSISVPLSADHLSDDDVQLLQKGQGLKVKGIIAFAKKREDCCPSDSNASDGFQIIKVVEVVAFYVMSRVEVVPTNSPKNGTSALGKSVREVQIRLGESSRFNVTIKNICSCPTAIKVRSSSATVVNSALEILTLEPYSGKDIELAVSTIGLESGTHESVITIVNLNNPNNELEIPVSIKVTSLDLRLDGRGDLNATNHLLLPTISVPNFLEAPCDAWFTLTNPTASELRFSMEALLIQPLSSFMSMHVLNRFSNSPLNWIELHVGGSVEIKVKVVVEETAKLTPETCPEWLLDSRGIQVGQIIAENELGMFIIPVRSHIVEHPCFEIVVTTIDLIQGGEPSFLSITNLSAHNSLTLDLVLERFQEFGVEQVLFPSQVTVPPKSTTNTPIQLLRYDIAEMGDVIILDVIDNECAQRQHRSVRLRCVEQGLASTFLATNSIPSEESETEPNSGLEAESGAAPTELIIIKGCSKRGRLYEIDLGQQDLGAGTVTRKITLELQRPAKVSYKIRTTPPDCSEWLSISRSEGTLDYGPGGSKQQSVVLSFSTNKRNFFSTYLVVDNSGCPSDVNYVKVRLEVVARVNSCNARAFHVVCNLLNDLGNIIFENVYYNQEYTSRSFTLVNNESIPLEFTLKLLNLDICDPTEVLFSTSKTIAKLFKAFLVPAESSLRVYIRLRPMRKSGRFLAHSSKQSSPSPSKDSQSRLSDTLPIEQSSAFDINAVDDSEALTPGSFEEREIVEVKEFDIIVNCRLVRDYQQVIHVKATCRVPQILVSSHDIVISAMFPSDGGPLICIKPDYDLVVRNLLPNQTLHLYIIKPVAPFTLETGNAKNGTEVDVPCGGQHVLKISLDIDETTRQLDVLRRERYVQVYAMIYNRHEVFEHVFVTIRLSLGHLQVFSLVWWISSRSLTFAAVEASVIEFLRHCNDTTGTINLAFQFRVIVDQLLYLTTITTSSDHAFHLASLLFSNIPANNSCFTTSSVSTGRRRCTLFTIDVWADGLRYYLTFFTQSHPLLEALVRIYSSAVQSTALNSTAPLAVASTHSNTYPS